MVQEWYKLYLGEKVKWYRTNFPGVRYRLHPTRKHGVKFDQYFVLHYKANGKGYSEAIGWASEGITARKAANYLARLREAHHTGQGPQTLAEMRAERRREHERTEKNLLSFGQFFKETYLPQAQADKTPETIRRECCLYKRWIAPLFADKPLSTIGPLDLERLKKSMADEGQSPRSICYGIALTQQVINRARSYGLYEGDNPARHVRKPSLNNQRMRFLSRSEAERLLTELNNSGNEQLHDITLLALFSGLRAGEIFALEWPDVDFTRQTIFVRNPKNRQGRIIFMTARVRDMLARRFSADNRGYVFKNRDGGKITRISNTFMKTVNKLGLNARAKDRRDKIVFHSMRHSFASMLVQNSVDLYVVGELLGHKTLSMTKRYSHFSPATFQAAMETLDQLAPAPVVEIGRAGIRP